jgi:uncharacterized protein involved in response to NO
VKEWTREPYRLFFPLGTLYAIWAAALWIGPGFHWSEGYPAALHAQLMIGGFLQSFVCGFLMTAIPRFTRSGPPGLDDLTFAAAPLFALPVLAPFGAVWLQGASLLSLLGLIRFAVMRFFRRQNTPLPPFAFIPVGLICGVGGLALMMTAPMEWAVFGRLLYLHGFVLALVLGVGSRLIPMLTGAPFREAKPIVFAVLGLVFLASFAIEVFASPLAGRSVRAALVTGMGLYFWSLWRLPVRRVRLSWGLWASGWFVIAGSVSAALLPAYRIDVLHLSFIGGLGMMTLMIASRVVLAHGGYDLDLERSLGVFRWTVGAVLFAAITRVSAAFMPALYLSHLAYASVLWCIGVALWAIVIGSKVLKVHKPLSNSN